MSDQGMADAQRAVDGLDRACALEESLGTIPQAPCDRKVTHTVRVHNCGDPAGTPVDACRFHLNLLADDMTTLINHYSMATVRCPRCKEHLVMPFQLVWEVRDL